MYFCFLFQSKCFTPNFKHTELFSQKRKEKIYRRLTPNCFINTLFLYNSSESFSEYELFIRHTLVVFDCIILKFYLFSANNGDIYFLVSVIILFSCLFLKTETTKLSIILTATILLIYVIIKNIYR